jgi:hypothetical protein
MGYSWGAVSPRPEILVLALETAVDRDDTGIPWPGSVSFCKACVISAALTMGKGKRSQVNTTYIVY